MIDLITEGTITGKVIIGIKVVMTMVTGAIIEMVDIRDGMEAIKEIGVEIGTKIAAIITRIEIKEIRVMRSATITSSEQKTSNDSHYQGRSE